MVGTLNVFYIFIVVLAVFLISILFKATIVVRQAQVVAIERLGKFNRMLKSGIHFVVPFIDQTRKVVWTFVKESGNGQNLYRYSEMVERID